MGVTSFLLDETARVRGHKNKIDEAKNKVQLAHEIQEAIGPSYEGFYKVKQALTDLEAAKAGRQANIKAASYKVAGEERLDKKFFKKFRPKLSNGDINEVHTTPNWDEPNTKGTVVTSDTGVLRELRSYYVWLFSEKESDEEASEILLAHLRKHPFWRIKQRK
jgi:hypothetical protein